MKNWEQQIARYVEERGFEVERNRKLLKDKEIDIFLPELKVGLELNGAYFHNSHKEVGNKPLLYHYRKTQLALNRHIRLYHLWSSSPNQYNFSVINRVLNQSLVFRKSLSFHSLSPETAKAFLIKNAPYLYSDKEDKFYGVYLHSELLAVGIFFKKSKQLMELKGIEFKNFHSLSSSSVYALLKYAQKCLRCKVVTTSIPRDVYPVLSGTFWSRIGFKQERIEKPWMFYYNLLKRRAYRRELFTRDQLKFRWDDFEPSLSEEENCYRHNLVRCYDSGRIKATITL